MNNFEKIKAMSIDEMAKLIAKLCGNGCETCPCNRQYQCQDECADSIKQWLEGEEK